MEMIKLNETPVRTSKNFGINNIKLENLNMLDVKPFSNVQIKSNLNVQNKNIDFDLKYEIEKELTNQLKTNFNQALYIEVPENHNEEEPTIIEFELQDNQALVDQIYIDAKENSKAEIIIKYKAENNSIVSFHNGIINVVANSNANVKVVVLNLLSENSSNYFIMNNKLDEKANVEYVIADFGGSRTITNNYSNLEGRESNLAINTMYLGNKEHLIDINYIAECYGEKSNVDIEVYGALDGNAQKNFKGTIDFKKGCTKSTGNENEYCMLLSKTAKSKALPMLLCREDDVQGNHSNSAGKIDEDKLYYIMSRGINEKNAKKLIIKAKFNSVISKIEESQREEIINEIDRRLS
jgi:Fe-S cluster assembly scaffold protein SufB